jgi:hypothetical protein
MAGQKNVYMRIKEETQQIIRIFAGELQAETKKRITDNEAVMEAFRRIRPDLVERVLSETEEENEEDK